MDKIKKLRSLRAEKNKTRLKLEAEIRRLDAEIALLKHNISLGDLVVVDGRYLYRITDVSKPNKSIEVFDTGISILGRRYVDGHTLGRERVIYGEITNRFPAGKYMTWADVPTGLTAAAYDLRGRCLGYFRKENAEGEATEWEYSLIGLIIKDNKLRIPYVNTYYQVLT